MLDAFLAGLFTGGVVDDLDIDDVDGDINSELVEVDGYERADGTYVEPHVRTAPDASTTNNLSFWDLVNF